MGYGPLPRPKSDCTTVAANLRRAIPAFRTPSVAFGDTFPASRRRGTRDQYVARPPDRSKTAPVLNEHSRLASQHTKDAASSTVPNRSIGIFERM